jgi:uncharacterized delta-60 repeat protein
MNKWYSSVILVIVLFLSACNIQPAPETLESAALQSMIIAPSSLNVPADSRTGVFLDLLGTFGSADTFSFTLVTPPAGVSIDPPSQIQSIINRFRRFQTVLRVGPNVVLGSHTITFRVTSGTVTRTATLNLTVTQSPANPTFKITVSPNSLEISRSSNRPVSVFVSRIKGFSQALTLSLDTSATSLTGVTANPVNLAGTVFTGSLSINASATASPFGSAFLTKVKGIAGSLTRQANLNITIKTPSGTLDPSFDGDGISNEDGDKFTLLSNDKIVLVQRASPNLIIKRLNVNGSRDTTFDGDGKIIQPDQGMGTSTSALKGIKALADNKLIIVGAAGANSSVIVIKLRANGQLDTSFSGDGVFTQVMPSTSRVESFAVQPDGKIIVGGFRESGGGAALIRILADGSGLDPNFGNLGVVTITTSLKIRFINEMVVQTDGKIVLAGQRAAISVDQFDSVVGRLLPSGAEDPDFEGGFQSPIGFGSVGQADDEFTDVALDSAQRIVVGGLKANITRTNRTAIAGRFNTSATLDDTFSGNGKLALTDSFLSVSNTNTDVTDLAIQADNKLVFLIDAADLGNRSLIVRLTVGGALDTTFNGTGKVIFPASLFGHRQIEIDSQGRIVVLGATGIARYAP